MTTARVPVSRPDWDPYFLGLAEAVRVRGECLRAQVGAVLVNDKHRVIATGYNGVEPGLPSCLDGICPRGLSGVPRRSEGGPGTDQIPCVTGLSHAEDNAVSDAYMRGEPVRGTTLYVTKEPCKDCTLMMGALQITAVWRDLTRSEEIHHA